MDELDEELLDLLEAPAPKPATKRSATTSASSSKSSKKQKKKRRRNANDSEEESEEETEEEVESEYEQDANSDVESDISADEQRLMEEFDESELQGLTELEREAKLSEWAERKQQLLEKMQIKRRLKGLSSSTSSLGSKKKVKNRKDAYASKKAKLEELKAKRLKGSHGNKSEISVFTNESDEEEDYADRIRSAYSKDASSGKEKQKITVEDLNSAQVSRDNLEKWMFAEFFESTVKHAYVRLGIGLGDNRQMTYRICQIVDVVEYHRNYKINGVLTKKALILRHGKAQKTFLMDVISNQPFTESEFQRWIRTMENEKQRLPSIHEIGRVGQAVTEAKNHNFTNEEIDYMVKERQRLVPVARNLANEKLHLIAKKEEAETQGKLEEAAELSRQIKEIQEAQSEYQNEINAEGSQAQIWAKLNERNRKKNLEEGRMAEIRLREEKVARRKEGKALDPFARIKAIETQDLAHGNRGGNEQGSDGKGSTPASNSGNTTPTESRRPSENGSSLPSAAVANGTGGDVIEQAFAEIEVDIDI